MPTLRTRGRRVRARWPACSPRRAATARSRSSRRTRRSPIRRRSRRRRGSRWCCRPADRAASRTSACSRCSRRRACVRTSSSARRRARSSACCTPRTRRRPSSRRRPSRSAAPRCSATTCSAAAISGSALQSWINGAIDDAPLDRLQIPVAVVATRQDTGRAVAFTRGDAGAAVRASSAIPGSWAPVEISGVTYVDGDISAPLPIAIARSFGARHVIAVDVAQNVRRAPAPARLARVVDAGGGRAARRRSSARAAARTSSSRRRCRTSPGSMPITGAWRSRPAKRRRARCLPQLRALVR